MNELVATFLFNVYKILSKIAHVGLQHTGVDTHVKTQIWQ